MIFPSWLYQLLPGDSGSALLSLVWKENASTANLAVLGLTVYTVPSDKVLVLTAMSIRSAPDALPIVRRQRMMADPPEGTTRYNFFDESIIGAAAAEARSGWWTGEVLIPGGWKVRAETDFSAAGAANFTSGELFGVLIPRGSFTFG